MFDSAKLIRHEIKNWVQRSVRDASFELGFKYFDAKQVFPNINFLKAGNVTGKKY